MGKVRVTKLAFSLYLSMNEGQTPHVFPDITRTLFASAGQIQEKKGDYLSETLDGMKVVFRPGCFVRGECGFRGPWVRAFLGTDHMSVLGGLVLLSLSFCLWFWFLLFVDMRWSGPLFSILRKGYYVTYVPVFYFNCMTSEPGWRSDFVTEFLSAEFTAVMDL